MSTDTSKTKLKLQTPVADKMLQAFTFVTQEGKNFNEVVTPGQRLIMECILNRGMQGADRWFNRIHLMAHTRYGKSMAVGAAVAVRASVKKEKWAIVAPTKEQAQIIMDYVLHFSINDPIISRLLMVSANKINQEYLTQRRSRGHITYKNKGEVRVYAMGQTMGQGARNVVEDEAGLIDNHNDSKIFRMLGDDTDNFLIKIGNPWFSVDQDTGSEHHFFLSYTDPAYYHIDIPIQQGILEGRVTEEFHSEVMKKPNYSILYQNTFPDSEKVDSDGYYPLFPQSLLKRAFVQPGEFESVGSERLGADPADSGENESVIATRSFNLAKIVWRSKTHTNLQVSDEIAIKGKYIEDWFIDKQGVGSGTVRKLQERAEYFRKTNPVNAGDTQCLKEMQKSEHAEQFYNLRSYIFWNLKLWLEQGNKIEECPGLRTQMNAVKYKNAPNGKILIISKDELRKRGIDDLGLLDAITFTFAPKTKKIMPQNQEVVGGVEPYYPDLGI